MAGNQENQASEHGSAGGNPHTGGDNRGGNGGDDPRSGGGDNHGGHGEKIHIFVNDQPVTVNDEKQTGASIKTAAIAQGVQIGADFILSIERGGGKTDLVGDDEKIKVHEGERFLAIQNDDNS